MTEPTSLRAAWSRRAEAVTGKDQAWAELKAASILARRAIDEMRPSLTVVARKMGISASTLSKLNPRSRDGFWEPRDLGTYQVIDRHTGGRFALARLRGQLDDAISTVRKAQSAVDLAEARAESDGARLGAVTDNKVNGLVSGDVVQAGVIHGDIRVNERREPREPPRQLPATSRIFVGREAEMAALTALARRSSATVAAAVCVVDGPAGVGKTALALQWGHRMLGLFPDGQLYLNLRGFGPEESALSADRAVRSLLEAMGMPAGRIPSDVDAGAALFRDLAYERKLLLVLDNARDGDQVRPLLPGTSRCFVVITTRRHLPELRAHYGAEFLSLAPLRPTESHELFTCYLGADRAAVDRAVLNRIARRCSDLPLALTIVAARLSLHSPEELSDVAGDLEDEQARLDALSLDGTPDTDVRAVISWSYDLLPPETARLLRLLSLHPIETIGAEAVASIAGIPRRPARGRLRELCSHNLMVDASGGRGQFHDVLRAYATERCQTEDLPEERRAATGRILGHYLHNAFRADRLLNSHRRPIKPVPSPSGVVLAEMDDRDAALSWFAAESTNIQAMARHAMVNGWYEHAWQLPWTLVNYFYLRGRWSELISMHLNAIEATRLLGDQSAEARTLHTLARAFEEAGRHDDALSRYQDALELYRFLDDHNGQANTLNGMSGSHLRLGCHHDALTAASSALRIYVALGDPIGRASTLNLLGRGYARLGDIRQGLARHSQALRLFRAMDDTYGQAHTLDAFGDVLACLGRFRYAAACYGRAVELHKAVGNWYYLATSHQRLASSLLAMNHHQAAEAHLRHALTIFVQLVRQPHIGDLGWSGVVTGVG